MRVDLNEEEIELMKRAVSNSDPFHTVENAKHELEKAEKYLKEAEEIVEERQQSYDEMVERENTIKILQEKLNA